VQGVDHGIHELLVLEAAAPAGLGNGVGHAGHVLHTAGQDHVRHAGLDHGHTGDHGLHAGDADPVDGDGRYGVRDAGQEGPTRVTFRVSPAPCSSRSGHRQ
jgi:hypothetical protein